MGAHEAGTQAPGPKSPFRPDRASGPGGFADLPRRLLRSVALALDVPVRVTVYGGLNEIGGNKVLVEDDGERLLLDFGTSLGARGQFFEEYLNPRTTTALADLIELGLLPDLDGVYREDLIELAEGVVTRDLPESGPAYRERTGEPFVHGVLVTHAHVDHFQDAAFLDPEIPLVCTRTTRTMLEAIDAIGGRGVESEVVTLRKRTLGELGQGATFPGDLTVRTERTRRALEVCPEHAWFTLGPFRVMAIPVDHSVPGAVAFLVEMPSGKRLLYTGDLRFHGRLSERTKILREVTEGLEPDLLLSEGTRITEEGGDDEAGIEQDVTQLVEGCEGLAIAEFAWKDTTRFDTLEAVARKTDRTLVVDPKLAFLLHRVDHLTEVPSKRVDRYDHVEVYLKRRDTHRYRPSDYARYKHEAGYLADWDNKALRAAWRADDEVTLRDPLAHWNEGVRAPEIRKAPGDYLLHLSYYDANELFDLGPPAGSRWIRCLTEPFSDEMALDLKRQCNWLDHMGLAHNVPPTGELGGLTHVSGHAAGDDLRPFLEAVGAERLVPIHTEAESLDAFEGLASEVVTFPELGFQQAAAGEAVIEL